MERESELPLISFKRPRESAKRKKQPREEHSETDTFVKAYNKSLKEKISKVSAVVPIMAETPTVIQKQMGEGEDNKVNQKNDLPPLLAEEPPGTTLETTMSF